MSSTSRTNKHPFIEYLEELREANDRQALAALRRGLGRRPGAAAEMYPYVVPRLPAGMSAQEEEAYYLVAALFASHPMSTSHGNLGDHLRAVCVADENRRAGVERRLVTLLAVHPDDLSDHLRQAISLLRSHEVPVNWDQLLRDIRYWDHPDAFVQRAWARAFWLGQPNAESEKEPEVDGK